MDSSAAVDPIPEIAAICPQECALASCRCSYGGTFGILPECRHRLETSQLLRSQCSQYDDSATRLQPVLYSSSRLALSLPAEYLKTDETTVDFMDYGLALGRRFRALKLWFVMRYSGRDGAGRHPARNLEDGRLAG